MDIPEVPYEEKDGLEKKNDYEESSDTNYNKKENKKRDSLDNYLMTYQGL